MILTASPWPVHNIYAPPRPSPLSVRSANVSTRCPNHAVMSQQSKPENAEPFSKRPVKQIPIIRSRDAIKERRRDLFFKKVQKDREEQRWGARGEQILRLDFISDQKRWEAEKARQAPSFEAELEEYIDRPSSSAGGANRSQQAQKLPWDAHQQQIEQEAEQLAEQEYRELDALVSAMEEEEQALQDSVPQHYGSDDEDYDSLFMDYMVSPDTQQSNTEEPDPAEMDAMDTS